MNEQLIVKNFGPIKDATVDFKKVTVFIGPTGGGKSTLAKLLAIVKQKSLLRFDDSDASSLISEYGLSNYFHGDITQIEWRDAKGLGFNLGVSEIKPDTNPLDINQVLVEDYESNYDEYKNEIDKVVDEVVSSQDRPETQKIILSNIKKDINSIIKKYIEEKYQSIMFSSTPYYIPAERIFLSAIGDSWPGIIRDDIGLPKLLVNFANHYSTARKIIGTLNVSFLNIHYKHIDGVDFIQLNDEELLPISESASGIQSISPLLVSLEHLSHNTTQTQTFIIEEPELNLYPTAQQGLLNWLVEKCTAGENDLTITTHSPYILASCNLLMEAYKVWHDRPELEAEIEKIAPRASWINPEEFAAYYVADGTVRSIQDERTDLIGGNGLDAVSGNISDAFRSLLRLKKQPA